MNSAFILSSPLACASSLHQRHRRSSLIVLAISFPSWHFSWQFVSPLVTTSIRASLHSSSSWTEEVCWLSLTIDEWGSFFWNYVCYYFTESQLIWLCSLTAYNRLQRSYFYPSKGRPPPERDTTSQGEPQYVVVTLQALGREVGYHLLDENQLWRRLRIFIHHHICCLEAKDSTMVDQNQRNWMIVIL